MLGKTYLNINASAEAFRATIQIYPSVRNQPLINAFISLGRTHAFISGWFLTLGYICIVALNASALALMFKYVFPSII